MDVQPCRDMKSPINHSTFDLKPFEGVSLGLALPGGGFPMDTYGRVSGVALAVGGGVDLSPIACCTFFCFYSRVSRGAIIACLTELEETEDLLLLLCKVHLLHSFLINS